MEEKLKAQETYYLNHPILSDPTQMLKYALMGLDMDGDIEIFFKNIYINQNARYKRPRMFIRLGPNYKAANNYTGSETFLLTKISNHEIRLYEFRNLISAALDKNIKLFKRTYVFGDLSKKGLLSTAWFCSSLGRKKLKKCKALIKELESKLDSLLKDKVLLEAKLSEMGSNLIFVEDDTLKKLKKKILNLDELDNYFNPAVASISYGGGYIGFGGGGFSGGGGGGFSGFGGGSFGGGGSGGSW